MATSGLNGTLGTSGGAISFPGVVSGIDYNSIIQQLTKLSLKPTVALNAQIATLNNANVELVKINTLLNCVQNSLANLSNPDLFQAYSASSTNPLVATATGITGQSAVPGSYLVESVTTATSSTVTSNAAAGHSITDVLTAGPYAGLPSDQAPLAASYASVSPTNGSGSLGQITVDGVAVQYNVTSQSLDQILANIQTAVQAVDPGFTASLVGGKVQFASASAPISIGSSSDKGNLLDVLKLSNAQLSNTPTSGSITSTANLGGINPTASFNATNSAGFVTPVTSGFFTLNGVKITVAAGQNVADVVQEINQSSAGVVASVNSVSGQLVLTASQTGPTGIVLGKAGDTSNFLTAAGLTGASGATVKIGSQAEVDILNPDATTSKYFSNSNTVTTAIPGVALNLVSSEILTPFTVTVAQSTTQLVNAVQNFACVYNAAISEINAATAPPVVTSVTPGSGGTSQSIGGGVLWGNNNIEGVKNQLVQLVSGFLGSSSNLNSLSQIGLQLTDSFQTFTTGNNSDAQGGTGGSANGNTNSPVQQTTYQGTDGQLQALNVASFEKAFASNPNGVFSLLTGSTGLTSRLGAYLTGVTGAPTILDSGVVGTVPATSLLNNYETTNTDSITNLQQQVKQLTDNANAQANNLRSQFTASEAAIAQLQAEQQQLAAALGFSVSPSSSSS